MKMVKENNQKKKGTFYCTKDTVKVPTYANTQKKIIINLHSNTVNIKTKLENCLRNCLKLA